MPASHAEPAITNGHDGHAHPPPATGKKGKAKKGADPNEASRLLAARISQLEQDAAGEKDQELEIGTTRFPGTQALFIFRRDSPANACDSRSRSQARGAGPRAANDQNGRLTKD